MSYVEQNLMNGEEILYRGEVSRFYSKFLKISGWFYLIVGIATAAFGIGIAFLLLGLATLMYQHSWSKGSEFVVTNKRIICKTGFVSRQIIDLGLNKVETIQAQQGIIGRIGNYGHVEVSGTGSQVSIMKWIENPMEFRKQCLEAMNLK